MHQNWIVVKHEPIVGRIVSSALPAAEKGSFRSKLALQTGGGLVSVSLVATRR